MVDEIEFLMDRFHTSHDEGAIRRNADDPEMTRVGQIVLGLLSIAFLAAMLWVIMPLR